jgi:hypothetical protein
VVDKEPTEVTPADVMAFIDSQFRARPRAEKMVRIADGSAATAPPIRPVAPMMAMVIDGPPGDETTFAKGVFGSASASRIGRPATAPVTASPHD